MTHLSNKILLDIATGYIMQDKGMFRDFLRASLPLMDGTENVRCSIMDTIVADFDAYYESLLNNN